MKHTMLTALLVTAAVVVAACGAQPAPHPSAPPTPQPAAVTATPQPAGTITEFAVPTPGGWTFGITTGPDGNLWFTEWDQGISPLFELYIKSGTLLPPIQQSPAAAERWSSG